MSTEKRLGKLKNVRFGHCGYQGAALGLALTIEGEGWGVTDSKSAWDAELIESSEHSEWDESDRDRHYAEIMRYVSKLLADAKVESVDKLNGIPVEATFDGMVLKSWRILTEVL